MSVSLVKIDAGKNNLLHNSVLRKNENRVNRLENTPPRKFKGLLSKGFRFFVSPALTPLHRTAILLIFNTLLLTATSCIFDNGDDATVADGGIAVELSLQTRSMTSTSTTYEVGSQWENYIDIAGGDYRLYFFTYDPSNTSNTESNNRLISEFNPYDVMAVEGSVYTRYTITGNVEDEITEYSNFKVVILANWGEAHYPTGLVTIAEAGDDASRATTIDDLCTAQTAVFDAFAQNGAAALPSSTLHIPFYGVREYSGVTWRSGWRTILDGDITLLRSVAKVEVVLNVDDSDVDGFDSIVLSGYNPQGYCAPTGIYLQSDYDSGYTDWTGDFVNSLHLVSGGNDSGAGSNSMTMANTGDSTWECYVPEYDNSGTDYSSLKVTIGSDEYEIYFGNYDDNGICNAYNGYGSADDRYDIFRNNLYRFTVTVNAKEFWVKVERWDDVYDNDWTFGNMDGTGEILPVGSQIVIEGSDGNDYCFTVISENREVMITNELMDGSPAYYFGDVVIPETVVDMDNLVEYTVVAIDEGCFSQGEEITSITIPKTIREIGEYAFYECVELEYITIYCTTLPTCGDSLFENTPTKLLYVPAGYADMYRNADQWGDFTEILEIED